MKWHKSDIQGLAVIDSELGEYPPAQSEIIRQVILATGDFAYQELIYFSDQSLALGTAAIAARTAMVIDVSMVQAAIIPTLQASFANGSYVCTNVITRPQTQKSEAAWGMETLAQRYPHGIFIIGESQSALATLVTMVKEQQVQPAFVIATPPEFIDVGLAKAELQTCGIPHIMIAGQRGGSMIAASILKAMVGLAWETYGTKDDF